MNSAVYLADPACDNGAVDELLLRVAQRADQLARETEHGREHDLENWLQAENEMLGRLPLASLTTVS